MNILYVHRTQGKGVEGVHIAGMVESWRKLGHHVDVLSPNSRPDLELNSDAAATMDAKPVSREKSVTASTGPAKRSGGLAFLASHMPELGFEIMELGYNFLLSKRMAALFARKKYDFVFERTALMNFACVDFCAKRNVPVFLEVNFTADMPLVRKRSPLLEPLANAIDLRILKKASHNFPVSTYLKDHMVKRGVPAEKITVITNAADPDVFRLDVSGDTIRQKYNLNGKTVVGFVGGFYPWHGLELLVDAMELAVKRAPNLSALLVGDGPMRPVLEKKIKDKDLETYFHFAGKQGHKDLPGYNAAFDLGVMPDSNVYGSPMKIFEYMAMEKPVVAADYGPLRDGIDHNVHGKLFKPGDAAAFAQCLVEMANEPEKRVQMGKNGRERIVNDRNWLNQAKKVIEIYMNIVHDSITRT